MSAIIPQVTGVPPISLGVISVIQARTTGRKEYRKKPNNGSKIEVWVMKNGITISLLPPKTS